jgi:DNA-binding NarL/FixJ family response regulator
VALVADRLGDVLIEERLDAILAAGARLVILSEDPSPDRLSRLLARDLFGYLSLDAGPGELVAAIQAVARGEVGLNPSVLSVIVNQWRRLRSQPLDLNRRRPVLTPRELDILVAMSDGLTAKAIAARLGVALKTVENHKIHIFEKLGVRSHAHAVTVAMAYGLTAAADGAGVGVRPQSRPHVPERT